MEVTKKFVNKPSECVDESIRGLVLANPGLECSKDCQRVVLRASKKSEEKVALIAGGGSGHEPFAAGFVGKGFLDAAVCGDVFASPPSDHVLSALNSVANKAGAIAFVINYTGDRLNFGLALERFQGTPNLDLVFIADDVALESKGETSVGRRGLAGAILLLKIAGSMAEKGKSFQAIVESTRKVNDHLGTMGLSLYPCSLPGKPPLFDLPKEKIELGLGIHGEPGCERIQMKGAKEIVTAVMEKLVKSSKLNLKAKDRIVVLLNNLGSVSQIEMNVLQMEVIEWIQSFGAEIVRFYSGTFMTSLDAHGISVTILKVVDDAWLEHLESECDVPAWKNSSGPFKSRHLPEAFESSKSSAYEAEVKGATVSKKVADRFKKSLEHVFKKIEEFHEELNRLDGKCGDGDCGDTLLSAAKSIKSVLDNSDLHLEHPQVLFLQLSTIFEKVVGGTSGAIYALMLSAAASAFKEDFGKNSLLWALKSGLEAIEKYGHARPGDRTMVDALNAAVEESQKPEHSWESVVEAAEKAAQETAKMEAKAGRASYTSSEAQSDPDAGAMAVAYWMRALLEAQK